MSLENQILEFWDFGIFQDELGKSEIVIQEARGSRGATSRWFRTFATYVNCGRVCTGRFFSGSVFESFQFRKQPSGTVALINHELFIFKPPFFEVVDNVGDHLPAEDLDGDGFSRLPGLRGSNWRGSQTFRVWSYDERQQQFSMPFWPQNCLKTAASVISYAFSDSNPLTPSLAADVCCQRLQWAWQTHQRSGWTLGFLNQNRSKTGDWGLSNTTSA